MTEKMTFFIAGVVASTAQFVLYKAVLPKFYKEKKVPSYWQIFIPVLLFLVSNTLYTDKKSLLWLFIAYIGVYAVLSAIYIFRVMKKIDKEAENDKN